MDNLERVRTSINFDNTYFRNLVGFYSPVDADRVPDPNLLCFNHKLGTQPVSYTHLRAHETR